MRAVLDTGEPAFWTRTRREELRRCHRCEWHPATQGHHEWCPDRGEGIA